MARILNKKRAARRQKNPAGQGHPTTQATFAGGENGEELPGISSSGPLPLPGNAPESELVDEVDQGKVNEERRLQEEDLAEEKKRTALHKVINEVWGDPQIADFLFDRISQVADPNSALRTEDGFRIKLLNGHEVEWTLVDDPEGPGEAIIGPKRGFKQEDAEAMVALARIHGWTGVNVHGSEAMKEMMWLAVQRENMVEQAQFNIMQSMGMIPEDQVFVPMTVDNFRPSEDSAIYQQWLREQEAFKAAHPEAFGDESGPAMTPAEEPVAAMTPSAAPEKKPSEAYREEHPDVAARRDKQKAEAQKRSDQKYEDSRPKQKEEPKKEPKAASKETPKHTQGKHEKKDGHKEPHHKAPAHKEPGHKGAAPGSRFAGPGKGGAQGSGTQKHGQDQHGHTKTEAGHKGPAPERKSRFTKVSRFVHDKNDRYHDRDQGMEVVTNDYVTHEREAGRGSVLRSPRELEREKKVLDATQRDSQGTPGKAAPTQSKFTQKKPAGQKAATQKSADGKKPSEVYRETHPDAAARRDKQKAEAQKRSDQKYESAKPHAHETAKPDATKPGAKNPEAKKAEAKKPAAPKVDATKPVAAKPKHPGRQPMDHQPKGGLHGQEKISQHFNGKAERPPKKIDPTHKGPAHGAQRNPRQQQRNQMRPH